MSGELQCDAETGSTIYFQLRNSAGQIWRIDSAAFENYATANIGHYNIPAAEQGTASGLFAGDMPAVGTGRYNVVGKKRAGGSPAEGDVTVAVGELDWTGSAVVNVADIYHADIQFTKDDANAKDEYTVAWFKNGVPITSGITLPKIQVIKRVDGTDLVALVAMSQIGTTGTYKYDEPTNRLTAGEAVVAKVTATIDSVSRSFERVIMRDSA